MAWMRLSRPSVSPSHWPAWLQTPPASLGLFILFAALYLLWLAVRPADDWLQVAVSHLVSLPLGLLAARASLARRSDLALPSYFRRAWTYLGLAIGMWLAGGLIWLALRLVTGQSAPLPSLGDPVYMAGHLLALAALAAFPFLPSGPFGRLRVLLDMGILSGVSLTLGWLLLIQPAFSSSFAGDSEAVGAAVWQALYPALNVALIIALLNVAITRDLSGAHLGFRWLAAGLATLIIGDLAYSYLNLRGQIEASVLFDLGRLGGFALLGYAARSSGQAEGGLRLTAWAPWRRRFQALLPLAAGLALGAYTLFNWQASGQLDPFALWMTVLLGVAVIARQGVLAGETELRQYAQLVENAADPAFVCDRVGRLRLVNPALAAAIGHASTEALQQHTLFDFIVEEAQPADVRVPTRGFWPLVFADGWSGEISLRRVDGSEFPVYLSLRPVPDEMGAPLMMAGTAHDLSVQKRQQSALIAAYESASNARQALQDLNAQLEAKVAEKTRELASQNEELKTLDRLKSEFVSLVSHELRAPLTNIAGGMELALLRSAELPERAHNHLTTVQAEIRRLSRFVETILDLSALEAGRLPLTIAPLDVAAVLAPLQAQWAAASAAAPGGERVRVELPANLPPVLADERALLSVLFHLVDNALKYAPEGEVLVQVETAPFVVRFNVSDRGPGVPLELREVIFHKFQRLNAADAQTVYGHGLGLYMVRRLLNAMNSDIAVADAPEGGARFTFELPLALDDR
jgi:PAS domain S-box-containing protein